MNRNQGQGFSAAEGRAHEREAEDKTLRHPAARVANGDRQRTTGDRRVGTPPDLRVSGPDDFAPDTRHRQFRRVQVHRVVAVLHLAAERVEVEVFGLHAGADLEAAHRSAAEGHDGWRVEEVAQEEAAGGGAVRVNSSIARSTEITTTA